MKYNKNFIGTLLCIACVSALNVGFNYRIKFVIDSLTERNQEMFFHNIMWLFGVVIVMMIVEFVRQYLNKVYLTQVGYRIHGTLISKLIHGNEMLRKDDVGEYVSNISNDIETVKESYYNTIFSLFQGVVSFGLSAIALLTLDWQTALAILVASFFPIVFPQFFDKVNQEVQAKISEKRSKYNSKLTDYLSGLTIIRNSATKQLFANKLNDAYAETNRFVVKRAKLMAFLNVLTGLFFYATTIVILLVGGLQILRGNITVGALTSIYGISLELVLPVSLITESVAELRSVKPIVEKLARDDVDTTLASSVEVAVPLSVNNLFYEVDDTVILHGVNLTFQAGKKYLITGESGRGKSTLAYLLTKNLTPTSGHIALNGQDIQALSYNEVQQAIAFVPQKSHVFNDTVWDNMTLYAQANPQEVATLLNVVNLSEKFAGENLQAMMIDSESVLSGGQQQRIALVRALLQHKPILILDESLSGLDEDNFAQIERYLLEQSSMTVIHISHRVSEENKSLYDEVIAL